MPKLFNNFHQNVSPQQIQDYLEEVIFQKGFEFRGDKLTGDEKATIFISSLSHGIFTWTMYRTNDIIDVGMFILEKK